MKKRSNTTSWRLKIETGKLNRRQKSLLEESWMRERKNERAIVSVCLFAYVVCMCVSVFERELE